MDEFLEALLAALPGADEVRANLEQLGAVLVASSPEACAALSDRLAPEHLVIMTDQPQDVCDMVRHAGAIFLGSYAPVAVTVIPDRSTVIVLSHRVSRLIIHLYSNRPQKGRCIAIEG